MKDLVSIDGKDVHSLDIMNPIGMYENGQRQRNHIKEDMLPLSGKLIPEFDGRRSIRDMFRRHPSVKIEQNESTDGSARPTIIASSNSSAEAGSAARAVVAIPSGSKPEDEDGLVISQSPVSIPSRKRSPTDRSSGNHSKRFRSGFPTAPPAVLPKGQRSLRGFLKPKAYDEVERSVVPLSVNGSQERDGTEAERPSLQPAAEIPGAKLGIQHEKSPSKSPSSTPNCTPQAPAFKSPTTPSNRYRKRASPSQSSPGTHITLVQSQTWSELFTKPAPPRCESHDEPCISFRTNKPGMNKGRSFWMCAKPLGPSGEKERGTQWRCGTFIWCSDWNPGKEVGIDNG